MLNRGMKTLIATLAVAAALGSNPAVPALRHMPADPTVKTGAEAAAAAAAAAATPRRHRARIDDGCHEPTAMISAPQPAATQAGSCSLPLDATR